MTTRKLATISSALVVLAAIGCSTAATAAYKCVADGKVTYQQVPCPLDHPRNAPTVQELNAEQKRRRADAAATAADKPLPATPTTAEPFRCDGRQRCTQMTSCAEAKYFLARCPGVQMDGNRDGVPCEQQWCRP